MTSQGGIRTQYYTACSLDGFIATLDGSLEWLFPLGKSRGDELSGVHPAEVGALAMGASTYEWILRHVVEAGPAAPGEWPYQQPTWVFSSRDLPAVPGAEIRFVRGDARPVHEQMRAAARGKNI